MLAAGMAVECEPRGCCMAVKERPILFSGDMVRAILDGRKSQTRRVVKEPFDPERPFFVVGRGGRQADGMRFSNIWCPYGQPGDRLWVRETWNVQRVGRQQAAVGYRAGGDDLRRFDPEEERPRAEPVPRIGHERRWRPSIHMPRWASRITLEITGVRVERVQDITGHDVEAEGVTFPNATECTPDSLTERWRPYRALWDSLNAKRGYGWDANPWVWVIEFKRVAEVPA